MCSNPAAVVLLAGLTACGGRTTPASPTPAPPPAPAPVPAPPPTGFTVSLPIAASDTATASFGLNPFGIHFGGIGAGGHGLDGHPGWDVEFRIGAPVRAAADGVVQSSFADVFAPDRFTVQIQHESTAGTYRTVYTNITTVDPVIQSGARVTAGQVIGIAGTQSIVNGTVRQTYAMTHFQVDDFRRNEGLTNPNAVSPAQYLSPAGLVLFESVWRTAAYSVELTEPFPTNPRDASFPFTRAWMRETGTLPARFECTRLEAASSAQDYAWLDASGAVVERGSLVIAAASPLSAIDLRPSGGAPSRLGVYDVVGDTLRIDIAGPGAPRPSDLTRASLYRTR